MSVIKSANTIEKMQEALEVGIKEDSNGDNKSEKCFSILYIQYKPRFKHFRPPLLNIFMWAYKVDRKILLKQCYPSAIKSDIDTNTDKTLNIEFSCNTYKSQEIDKVAEKLKEAFDDGTKTGDEN